MRRLYPSIPHLPGSRAGGDRTLSPSEARRCVDRSAARPGETVVVQEKLDGSCVAVVREAGRLVARGREGRLCAESQNEARRGFAAWVAANEARLGALVVGEGEAACGEWLALVHGTRYRLAADPFVPFDVLCIDPNGAARVRLPHAVVEARAARAGLSSPAVVHRGGPLPIDDALRALGPHGRHGAIDPPEGLVFRVERGDRVLLVAKWVRPDKVDGAMLPETTGGDAIYNWRPT